MSVKFSKTQLIKRLSTEGFQFKEFQLEHIGRYTVGDADWNYKDIPHLHHVHELAEAMPSMVSDDFVTTINTQKMLGMKLPLSVVNFETGPNEQTYYTTLFWFVLIIHTQYQSLGPLLTRVLTTYAIGSPWFLRWVFPFMRSTITKNYKVLMAADIPMRTRRGELRSRGFQFLLERPSYSFLETMTIMRTNVIPPTRIDDRPAFETDLVTSVPHEGEVLLGSDDDLGLRAFRHGEIISLYPRICPHEGSCLDKSEIKNNKVSCPWHGRQFDAIGTINMGHPTPSTEFVTEFTRVVVTGTTLSLYPRDGVRRANGATTVTT